MRSDPGLSVAPPRPLWRNRDYLLIWGGQAVSSIGSQASQLTLPLLMLALTGSPAQAGVLGGLRGLAYALFGLPAGALSDRWNRRTIMLLCDTGRALALASIPIALLLGRASAVQLYAVSFIEGTLFILFGLAETACLTQVVTPLQLPTAIAQSQATDATASLVGPPLGGALYAVSRSLPFVADAVSYGVSVLSVLCLRINLRPQQQDERRALRHEIGEGVRWIWRRPVLRLLLQLNFGVNLIYGGWPLLLIELGKRLGATAAGIGFIFAGGGIGLIAGSLCAPLVQRRLRVGAIVICVAWIFAISWPPYAQAPNPILLGVVNATGFFCIPITGGTQFSYRLLLVPDALQGRVNSVFRLSGFGGQTAGFVLIGVLLQWHGPVATVWITTGPAFALALLPTLSSPLRRAGTLRGLQSAG